MAEVSTSIPDPPKFYQIADDFSYSPTKIKYYSLFVAFFTLGTGAYSIYRGIDNHSVVHNQMHTSMLPFGFSADSSTESSTIVLPVSYFTMDWLMTPMRKSVVNTVMSDLCDDNGVNCDPQKWQSQDVCKALDPVTYDTSDKVTDALLAIGTPDDAKKEEEHIYKNTRTKYRHISVVDVCNMEKIGAYHMYENNEMSWSIGSSHNTYILLAGAFGVLTIITTTTLLHTWREGPEKKKSNQSIMAFAVFIFVAGTYWYASSASTDFDGNYHRPMGMASFVYSTVAVVLTLLVFSSDGVVDDDKESYAKDKGSNDNNIPMAEVWHGNSEMKPMLGEQQQLNVSGFVTVRPLAPANGYNVGARIVHGNLGDNGKAGQSLAECGCMSHPRHSKFIYGQLFAMPLVFLALVLQKKSYGLDTTTQIVGLLALAVALIDVVLYRLWWAFNIQMSISNKEEYTTTSDVEYRDLIMVTCVAFALQTSVYVYFLMSELFHVDVYWIIVTWLAISSLLKLVSLSTIYQARSSRGNNKMFDLYNDSAHRFVKLDAWVFWILAVVFAVFVYGEFIFNTVDFDETWLNLKEDKDGPVLVTMWGPRWMEYHHIANAGVTA